MNNRQATADSTMFALLHAARAYEDHLEAALDMVGLSSPKLAVLSELVNAGEPLALSDLAARLSCVRSNMTQLVDRLEADGLVQRVDCPSDRRLVKAEITRSGRESQKGGAAAMARVNAAFAGKMSATDRSALDRALAALK